MNPTNPEPVPSNEQVVDPYNKYLGTRHSREPQPSSNQTPNQPQPSNQPPNQPPLGERVESVEQRLVREAQADRLLRPSEVARLFRVDPKTVTRWALAGRLLGIRTPGGHLRFRSSVIQAILDNPEEL